MTRLNMGCGRVWAQICRYVLQGSMCGLASKALRPIRCAIKLLKVLSTIGCGSDSV